MKIRNILSGEATEVRDDPPEGWTIPEGWEQFDGPMPIIPDVIIVPNEIPLWSFRAVINLMGLAPSVESLMNALPEPQKTVATIQWNYGNFILRDHPLIIALGTELGLTKEQIDNVFVQAAKLI